MSSITAKETGKTVHQHINSQHYAMAIHLFTSHANLITMNGPLISLPTKLFKTETFTRFIFFLVAENSFIEIVVPPTLIPAVKKKMTEKAIIIWTIRQNMLGVHRCSSGLC